VTTNIALFVLARRSLPQLDLELDTRFCEDCKQPRRVFGGVADDTDDG
jgi:hypothetical protein